MRRALVLAAAFATIVAATVVAQRSDAPPDRSQRRPAEADRAGVERGGADRAGAEQPPPPGVGPDTRLEWFMLRPAHVRVREAWQVGRFECKPWNAPADAEKAFVRVVALIYRDPDNAREKAAGMELVLENEDQESRFLFDAEQVPDLLGALDALDAASQKLREAAQGSSRRAVWTLNGLEIGMNPRRTGGYLAPMAPDQKSTGLSPDDFGQLRRLLQDARDVLARESAK
jgi:hypothetical protein